MQAVLNVVLMALQLLVWVLIAQAILSWLIAFGVVNTNNQFVATVYRITHSISDPLTKPIRRFVPPLGGLDLSFIVLIFGIYFVQQIIIIYLYPMVIRMGI
ncbi:YggT family protein [Hirschia maritima]|uniref:YggT family protein n=1 Tax=Hirschia maritima TaxID=1121961 RepID=UPI00047553D4|nr:YggT family protein [Hirschia maritima]